MCCFYYFVGVYVVCQLQGDLIEGVGSIEDQYFFVFLDCGFFQWYDGFGGGNIYVDGGFVIYFIWYGLYFGGRYQGVFGLGIEWGY